MLYLVLAALVTWPLVANLGAILPGPSNDALLHYWNGWYVGESLANGRSPYRTDLIFFPDGVSLVYHNFAWLNIIPWLLLRPVIDGVAAYNLVILLHLAAAGAAAYLLARHLTKSRVAALLAGTIYLAWPFRLTQLDHPNLIATLFVPLFFLFLVRLLEEPRPRHMAAAGICLALVGYTRWQLLIPVAVLTLLFLTGSWRRWIADRRQWQLLAGTAGLALLLLSPAVTLLAVEQLSSTESTDDLLRSGEETTMATDLLAYVTPSPDHLLFGEWTAPLYDRYYADRSEGRRFSAYVGWLVLILVVLGVWQSGRRAVPWLLMGGSMILLALGATLRINGTFYPEIPTLFSLAEPLFIFQLVRVPDRFNIFLALPVAVLAAYGVLFLLRRLGKDGRRTGAVVVTLVILVLVDYGQIPIPFRSTGLTPLYATLGADPEPGAVLEIPINTFRAKEYMFAQQVHRRPLLFGHVSRPPAGAFAFIDAHPLLRELRRIDEFPPWHPDVSRQLAALSAAEVAFMVLQKQGQGPDRLQHWQRYLAYEPQYEDEEIAVYAVDPEAGRDFEVAAELAPGLGPIGWIVSGDCFAPGDVLAADVSWGSTAAPGADFQAELRLVDEEGNVLTSPAAPLVDGWPSSEWPAGAVAWGYYAWTVPEEIPAGSHTLQLHLADQNDAGLDLGAVTISRDGCRYPIPENATQLEASFGGQLRPLGYELEQRGETLFLTLYWRAEQHMSDDYKVFVHVFPESTGVPVAQDDSVPRRGGFPTRFWYIGEVIADRIPVDLAGAPAGTYGIAVGVYNSANVQRLPLVVDREIVVPDGRLVLSGETVTVE